MRRLDDYRMRLVLVGCVAAVVLGDGQIPHRVRELERLRCTERQIKVERFRVTGLGLVRVAEFLKYLTEMTEGMPQPERLFETSEHRHDLLVVAN